jgi:hypothetical protein
MTLDRVAELMEARFQQLADLMEARFQQVDGRFEQVDARFISIENGLAELRIDMLERFHRVDMRIDRLSEEMRQRFRGIS